MKMVSRRHPTTMEKFPDEVVSEIFMRLLAKQLAQMRCVCKSWNALLSHSSFVKSHLHHSTHENDKILLLFRHGFSFDRCPFTLHSSRSPNHELTDIVKLSVRSLPKDREANVIGSVNGLVCFSYGSDDDYVICIWNPSLSAVLTLPPCSLPSQKSNAIHLRFGYDPKTNDYKVVKFTFLFAQRKMVPQGEVYTMRRGLWQLIFQLFPSHITWIRDDNDVCVDGRDGHLHWLGSSGLDWNPQTIVAFDLGAETFSEIPLPHSIAQGSLCRYHYLGVMSGKLCVTSKGKDGEWEVWVMDEYGVSISWVKHYTFTQFSSNNMYLYGFTSHSEFLFEDDNEDNLLALYDPVAGKTKTFQIPSRFGFDKIVEYIDSLVWVAPAEHETRISQF